MPMDFLQRNLFCQMRAEAFGTQEEMEPMTTFKQQKIELMRHNLGDMPQGEYTMSSRLLNYRLQKIEEQEHHAIDTSVTSLALLRIIVQNINGTLANGVNLHDVVRLGHFLREDGDKVDFVKIDVWLQKLHIQRMAQFIGSVLIHFFQFEQDEIPFVHHVERGAGKLTLRSLYYNSKRQNGIQFTQGSLGLVHATGGGMRKRLRHTMRYFPYAPIEATCLFLHTLFKSIAEIEE